MWKLIILDLTLLYSFLRYFRFKTKILEAVDKDDDDVDENFLNYKINRF